MRVSLNIVKQFTTVDVPVDVLVKKINEQLGHVEEVIDLAARYKDALIVKVVHCDKHPDADRLNVTKIDDGGKVKDVPRDADGLVQVVCGAPNVHAGMLAVWLPPGSTVPASFDDKEPFVLGARELRGVLSQGMLASPKELALGDSHDGILEINPDEQRPLAAKFNPGDSFAETYGLNDTIIDIENKMFTHRPDLFGQLGVAREISAILGGVTESSEGVVDTRFENPDWYWLMPEFAGGAGLKLEVYNDAPDKVTRLMAVAMKNIEIKPSPLWLQCALTALGSKPINNIVDITNYVMLMTAQPTHAYDYDKLRGHKLGARMAKKGEKITLLNHKTYELDEDDIVIADGEGPIGLAGIMGGGDSEVDENTKNIVLEVATFDMYAVRKSSMRHGVFTDALARFNKGQSPLQNNRILNLLMMSMKDVSSAEQASDVFDLPTGKWRGEESLSGEIEVSTKFINDRLGVDLTVEQIGNLLRRANFASYPSEKDANTLLVTAPFWRTDIELPEDLVEEVGRLYGYDKLPRKLPRRSIKPATQNQLLITKQLLREKLASAGANEVLTYSFVNGDLLDKVGQDKKNAFRLNNALSPDLQYYRLSLTPSLLEKVHMNIKAGHDEFALFEIGKAHLANETDEDGLPREDETIALVVAANDKLKKPGAAYYQAEKYLINLLRVKLTFKPVPEAMQKFDITKPFDIDRTAFIYAGDKFIGLIGELRSSVRRALKLPKYTAGFELDTTALTDLLTKTDYTPLPRFPKITQDVTLRVAADLPHQELYDFLQEELVKIQPEHTYMSLESTGIYQADDDKKHKNVTLRLVIASYDKTMRDSEVAKLLDDAADAAKNKFAAERA